MAYKKPQDPLTNNGFGIYPLTTADQVILSDGSRLEKNGQISIGGGTVKTVSGVAPDSAGNVALTAEDVSAATAEEVSVLKDNKLDKTGTAADSSKLGGKTLADIMLEIYPVGAVYISVNSTSPASLFGGTWEQLNGRFLIGTGIPENNDDGTSPGNYDKTPGSKGGEATNTLTERELPVLSGSVVMHGAGTGGTVVNTATGVFSPGGTESGYRSAELKTGASSFSSINFNAGEGRAHNNLPPYLAVYMWKRVS